MSYLLTEIALEMLGYKFYDTNGVFHLTNFQQTMANVQNDVHPDEPSLMDFIHQPSNSSSEQQGCAAKCPQLAEPASDPLTMKPLISSGNSEAANLTPITSTNSRTSAKALSKILDYESVTIRSQISQRLDAVLRERATTSNKERYQKQCLSAEKNKIIEDANEMKKFRLILEERLRRIDPRPYATYQRAFGPK
ncbi:hypothetical protein KR093_003701 [Drosophila rubida]|uniref:Uncharacterized protein n=1 Tax=Drosophila rubida TaxID=30044 RepID=A0AAD4K3V8_9MUSC|nr:hypothetical protein KR093_003701 [Drosophila rubida]